VTTITTVGFGDISAQNSIEEIFMACMMIIGVMAFSLITGSLSSGFSSLDQKGAKFKYQV